MNELNLLRAFYRDMLASLEGRQNMNLRTAELHPELEVREQSRVRAAAYGLAIDDVIRLADDHTKRIL